LIEEEKKELVRRATLAEVALKTPYHEMRRFMRDHQIVSESKSSKASREAITAWSADESLKRKASGKQTKHRAKRAKTTESESVKECDQWRAPDAIVGFAAEVMERMCADIEPYCCTNGVYLAYLVSEHKKHREKLSDAYVAFSSPSPIPCGLLL
jgi:hypothetical protein